MINKSQVKPISYKGEESTLRITRISDIPIFAVFREIAKYNFKVKTRRHLFRNTWNSNINFCYDIMDDSLSHEYNEILGIKYSRNKKIRRIK